MQSSLHLTRLKLLLFLFCIFTTRGFWKSMDQLSVFLFRFPLFFFKFLILSLHSLSKNAHSWMTNFVVIFTWKPPKNKQLLSSIIHQLHLSYSQLSLKALCWFDSNCKTSRLKGNAEMSPASYYVLQVILFQTNISKLEL